MIRCVLVCGVAWLSATAYADTPVELRYTAPAECPGRSAVEAAIRERMPSVAFASGAPRVFAITITTTLDGFSGTLVAAEGSDKRLAAHSCDDLVSALALVTAIAIDPSAAIAPAPPPPAPHPAPPPPPAPSPWAYDAAVGATVDSGITPDALFALALDGRARWHRYAGELGLLLGRDSTSQQDATATFTWLAARPSGCWLALEAPVEVAACGHVEVGLVRAGGGMIVNQRDLTRLWLAAGAHATARYPLTARIFGQLQLGASLPFVRDRYIFAPNVQIHETAAITGWLAIGVGMQI